MRYLALDPGGKTGWVVYENGIGSYGQLGPELHHWKLWRLLLQQDDYMSGRLVVICERFDNRNAEFAVLTSNEYIGVVRLFEQCQMSNGNPPQVYYQGSNVKRWATNEKLKKFGALIEPVILNKDANDAMRHLFYFLCHHESIPYQERNAMLELLKET
jgi:hypothetical protein